MLSGVINKNCFGKRQGAVARKKIKINKIKFYLKKHLLSQESITGLIEKASSEARRAMPLDRSPAIGTGLVLLGSTEYSFAKRNSMFGIKLNEGE